MQASESAVQHFSDYIKFEKRFSQHTVIAYTKDLEDFFSYLHTEYGQIALSEISHSFIRSWLVSMKENKMTSRSLNRKISTLKSFFKYLLKTGVISITPMSKIISPKNDKKLPHFVREDDIKRLFTLEFPDDWAGRTSRMILLLFYYTGMRVSELVNLKETALNASGGNIKLLGKGNKERIIPLDKSFILSLEEYTAAKNAGFGKPEWLLTDDKGKQLSARRVYDIVKKNLTAVTSIEKRSPHILRHSFATHLTNNGAELNAVKELLGHASLAATQVYTHNTIEKLKNVHKNFHPKA
jgi:integrase/recombinase XerC